MARCKFIKQKIKGAVTNIQHTKSAVKSHNNLFFHTVVEVKPSNEKLRLLPPLNEKIEPLPPVTGELASALAQLISYKHDADIRARRKRRGGKNKGKCESKISSYFAFKGYYARFIDRVPQSRISTVLSKVWVTSYPYKSAWEDYVEQYNAYERDLGIIEWMDKLFTENCEEAELQRADHTLAPSTPQHSSDSSISHDCLLANDFSFAFQEASNIENFKPNFFADDKSFSQNIASFNDDQIMSENESFFTGIINKSHPFSFFFSTEGVFSDLNIEYQIDLSKNCGLRDLLLL